MKEKLRFVLGSAAVAAMAVCLMGAALLGWLRTLTGALTRTVALAVMEPSAVLPQQEPEHIQAEPSASRNLTPQWRHSDCCGDETAETVFLPARILAMGPGAPPGVCPTGTG